MRITMRSYETNRAVELTTEAEFIDDILMDITSFLQAVGFGYISSLEYQTHGQDLTGDDDELD